MRNGECKSEEAFADFLFEKHRRSYSREFVPNTPSPSKSLINVKQSSDNNNNSRTVPLHKDVTDLISVTSSSKRDNGNLTPPVDNNLQNVIYSEDLQDNNNNTNSDSDIDFEEVIDETELKRLVTLKDSFLNEVSATYSYDICGCSQSGTDCAFPMYRASRGRDLLEDGVCCITIDCDIKMSKLCVLNMRGKCCRCDVITNSNEPSSPKSLIVINRSNGVSSDPQSPDFKVIDGTRDDAKNYYWYNVVSGFLPSIRSRAEEEHDETKLGDVVDEAVVYRHVNENKCLMFWSGGNNTTFSVEKISLDSFHKNLSNR